MGLGAPGRVCLVFFVLLMMVSSPRLFNVFLMILIVVFGVFSNQVPHPL